MIVSLTDGRKIDLTKGIDLSIPLSNNHLNPIAWGVKQPQFEPVKGENYVGLVSEGFSVNFRSICFSPHGHGTHTECLGHITKEIYSVNKTLKQFFFKAILYTVEPEKIGKDFIITPRQLDGLLDYNKTEALIIRTLPNSKDKKHQNYTGTNPPYFDIACIDYINELEIKHLLIDIPSVDKENDNGQVAFHHAFWEVPENPRFDRTITEMIYVPNEVNDGEYFLNLQTAPFENDATPSRPMIFEIIP